jgi:hypothetical protein
MENVTFGNDKKGKVLGTGISKVNGCFTLNDVALVDGLRYNMHVLDSSSKRVCGISRIGNVFQVDFSFAQTYLRCLISQSSFELWNWHRS